MCDDKNILIDYLIEYRVLLNSVRCPQCNKAMDFNRNSLLFHCYNVKYIHNCYKKQLKKKRNTKHSAFHNTWFAETRLNFQTIC